MALVVTSYIHLKIKARMPHNHPTLINKRVLLGITGGIAAYKTPDLVRKLAELGAQVRIVMSRGAEQFVTPLALQAVSGHIPHNAQMTAESESGMGHIDLARWADIVLIAPATANFIAQLNQGSGHDLLTTVCLATTASVVVSPAMNQQMWKNSTTAENVASLIERGVAFLGPDSGEQACGDVGPGRMLQPQDLAQQLAGLFQTRELEGKHVMLTAGPTWEAIDPVRGITNHSSGKMGYALAEAAAEAGAHVTLVSGPTSLTAPVNVKTIHVRSAAEMHAAVFADIAEQDIFIGVAAVADYRPVDSSDQKIKKNHDEMTILMTKNPDILADVAALKKPPFCVGFAAETNEVETYARAKLERKKLDLIVANHVGGSETGFGSDDNIITLITSSSKQDLPRASKSQLARHIVSRVAELST